MKKEMFLVAAVLMGGSVAWADELPVVCPPIEENVTVVVTWPADPRMHLPMCRGIRVRDENLLPRPIEGLPGRVPHLPTARQYYFECRGNEGIGDRVVGRIVYRRSQLDDLVICRPEFHR